MRLHLPEIDSFTSERRERRRKSRRGRHLAHLQSPLCFLFRLSARYTTTGLPSAPGAGTKLESRGQSRQREGAGPWTLSPGPGNKPTNGHLEKWKQQRQTITKKKSHQVPPLDSAFGSSGHIPGASARPTAANHHRQHSSASLHSDRLTARHV